MATKEPGSYGEAVVQAQALLRAGRLNDPGEHFPYKHEAVSALVLDDRPMGPEGEGDDRLRVQDYMSQAIADASNAYIAAQAAYLKNPGDDTMAAMDVTRDELQAARLDHRANRRGVNIGGVMRAPRAGE